MEETWRKEKGVWLFDLAHGNLDAAAVVKGFLKHYVLQGQRISDVQQDLHYHTAYGDYYLETAMGRLRSELEKETAR